MRQLILFAITMLAMLSATAQVCYPDTTITGSQGIFPNSDDGIPPARVGLLYQHTSTVKVPADTMVDFVGQLQLVFIDSIVLDTVIGVPAWATYACEPSSCGFAGGTSGCVYFSGTPLQGEGGKTYSISFITITYVRLAALPTQQFQQVDTVKDYYEMYVDFEIGIDEQATVFRIHPNPVSEILTLQFPEVPFRYEAIDLQGRIICQGNGRGTQLVDVRQWPVGIYLLRVWDGVRTMEQKVVVQR